jgi:hypothetical protein
MHGTIVIAGQTRGTPSVVQPYGWCTLYIIHRTYVLAFATTDTFVGIDSELLIVHHLAVEIFTNDI